MLFVAIWAALLLPWLTTVRRGNPTPFYTALVLASVGVVLLFFAKLPLYRQRRFFTLGVGKLTGIHRRLYRLAYVFIGTAIAISVFACLLLGACATTSEHGQDSESSAQAFIAIGSETVGQASACEIGDGLFSSFRKSPRTNWDAPQISIEVDFVKFSRKDIEMMLRQEGCVSADSLKALWRKGDAELALTAMIRAESGRLAVVKSDVEYIYPTEFNVTPITSSTTNGGSRIIGGVVEPGGFETREVGCIVKVTSEVEPKTQRIRLEISPESVLPPEWRDFGSTHTFGSDTNHSKMDQPYFPTFGGSTSLILTNGATELVCGNVDNKDPAKFMYVFVTARILDSAENSKKR